jgi:2-dehydro-3-deoxy-D-arabinonate dehydratase
VKLYRTRAGWIAESEGGYHALGEQGGGLLRRDDLAAYAASLLDSAPRVEAPAEAELMAPIESQEVWAAGVTYFRSRTARMEESKAAGGGDFYDRVYSAERPELFFKATPNRVVGPGAAVKVRSDSKWSIPEPELTLLVSPAGRILGYTAGNDMSARDIEGENPLYLPQAKVYERSCALGPCICLIDGVPAKQTRIKLEILRGGAMRFQGETTLDAMKREPAELVGYLFRDNIFPDGCFLLTGTGIVPPDDFTLAAGDRIRITIDGVGTLENYAG